MYGEVGKSFHRFPTINTARDVLRRELWVEAVGLPNDKNIIDMSIICGKHFEKGKPSLPMEIRAPNWLPSLHLKSGPEMVSMTNPVNNSVAETPLVTASIVVPPQREAVPIVPIMGPQSVPKDFNLPEFCRLCLAEGVQMVFPKDSRVYDQLASKISDHLRLTITVGELTRSLICKKCYENLEQFHQFRARCARQDMYLNMRKSLEPERKQPLRYKDNWYWYSCLGNNMNSVIWGCSVVCCPAFIVSHPSGRICSRFANHQHKQKMEDVKAVYCNGEYVFDGYRYSFELINRNRTLTFSCRSLKDPHNECRALLTSNDRSEVLSVGQHNHEREIIIESAVKDSVDGAKRSITLIRGFDQEIVFCQGFWYTTVAEQSNVSEWKCVRTDCTSTITMVNGTVQYFGTHCHLPVFLKWGAEEDKTIEPKTTTLMKVINPLPVLPKPTSTIQAIPPVALRESTTIVHSGLPTVTTPASTTELGASTMMTDIKTEPQELQIASVSSLATHVPPAPVRPQLNQPLVVSAAAMTPRITPPLPTKKLPNVSIRPNHHIQVMKRTIAPTVRVVPPARPKLVIPVHPPPRTSIIPSPVPTPDTTSSVTDQPPTMPKILHVMSLNLAHQPETTIAAEVPPDPVPQTLTTADGWDGMVSQIKLEPDPFPEDEPETITDEILPTVASTTTTIPVQSVSIDQNVNLPKPPPLTPRPMMLVSSASVSTNNTLDVTALDPDCMDGLETTVPTTTTTENMASAQETMPVEEDDDGLHDLQDDDEIPPIVPIDADIVSRIIGSEYTTRVLPNGKTQVIRKTILSRGSVPPSSARTTKKNVLPTIANRNEERNLKFYCSYPAATKRINSGAEEVNNSLAKKAKSTESSDPPETAIVDVDKSAAPEDEEIGQTAAEDPIAISIEPHQNQSNDEDSRQSSSSTNDESIARSDTPPKDDESQVQEVQETAPAEEPPAVASDQQSNQADKKPSASKSVQLVKLQRTEQMLSHEGHLYKMKWHNRRHSYWDCMLRDQVNCMAVLETVGEQSRHWRKFGSHNHKVPKPIINDENRSSYRMLTNEGNLPRVKHIPAQSMKISDIQDRVGRMMSVTKRRMFGYSITRIARGVLLKFDGYEYKVTHAIFPGFRWKCVSCISLLETDEKFSICMELATHDHEPTSDVVDLVDLVDRSVEARKPVPPHQSQRSLPQKATIDDRLVAQNNSESVQGHSDGSDDNSSKEAEQTSEDLGRDQEMGGTSTDETSVQHTQTQPNPVASVEEVDPIDAMLQEITGDTGQDSQGLLNPSTGQYSQNNSDDDDDDEEMTLDPSNGEMVKKGDLKRKEARKALLEDIVADEDDDEMEYLDPLTGEMRRKGDQASLATESPPEESTDQNVTGGGPSNDDFEEMIKKDSAKESVDTRKHKKPKKNSLAALKMVVDVHKRLKIPDEQRNFEVLIAPEDSSTCLIRFQKFTYELDVVHDAFSIWKCHLSPQYTCRGKVQLNKDCQEVVVTGVSHCHASDLEDMFTELPQELDGEIMDSDLGSTQSYTFFKRPDYVYQLRLDDGYLYNCLTISKTGVSCWRCADRQAHNCKAMFTMEGKFKSLLRNRFSHPHDPASSEAVESQAEGAEGNRSVDSDGKKGSAKRSAKGENEEDRNKQKRQTL